METAFKENTLHTWYGKPSKAIKYSHGGKNYEVLFAVTQLDDKSIHAVFSCPGGMPSYAAENNNYLKESKVFDSFKSFFQELNVKDHLKIDKIFCYNLFKGKQKSFLFKAHDQKYYQFIMEYNYDTHFLSKKIVPLSGSPMDQSIYEKEVQFQKKSDSMPHELEEKIAKYVAEKYKYEPEDVDKVITTPVNRVTFLVYKKLSSYNSKSFFCDKPMDIAEITNLAKGSYSESINCGYKSRDICTGVHEYNKKASKKKQISKILGFHHATAYDDKYCACDCTNDYVGLTNDFELCCLSVSSELHQKNGVDPEISFSIINL